MKDLMNSAFDIIEEIHTLGFSGFIVGGFIRDLFLNVTPKDADLVTNCPMDVLDSHWKTVEIGQSRGFGIVTINHNGFSFEIAQMRTDVYKIPKKVRKL